MPDHLELTAYKAARQERGTFEVELEGERFTFPKQVPAEFMVKMLELQIEHGTDVPEQEAARLMPELIGRENLERLSNILTWPEIEGLVQDLMRAYGMVEEKEVMRPNLVTPEAVKAEPISVAQ
jgi:hypothetical protein